MAGLFKLVVHTTQGSNLANEVVNVFGYRSNLAIINEEQTLATEFVTQVIPSIRNIIHASMLIRRVEVYNVSNGTGYYDNTLGTPLAGLRSGENMPGFNSWGYRWNRVNAGQRSGSKRFGYISESDVLGDVPTTAMLTVLNTAAGVFGAPIKVGAIDTWFPEILERKPTGVYPWTSHPILNVQFVRITTQNSRKR